MLEANIGLEEEYRRCLFNPLIQLSKECGYCPRGIYFTEGAIGGLVSESQGGFGFVYKGKAGSRLVAVKALKRDIHISLPEYNKVTISLICARTSTEKTRSKSPKKLLSGGIYAILTASHCMVLTECLRKGRISVLHLSLLGWTKEHSSSISSAIPK